jgi:signal transduction histidine kinase
LKDAGPQYGRPSGGTGLAGGIGGGGIGGGGFGGSRPSAMPGGGQSPAGEVALGKAGATKQTQADKGKPAETSGSLLSLFFQLFDDNRRSGDRPEPATEKGGADEYKYKAKRLDEQTREGAATRFRLGRWLAEDDKKARPAEKPEAGFAPALRRATGDADHDPARKESGADPKAAEDRKDLPAVVGPIPLEELPVNTPAIAVHLGSMRPQWLTAADGAETLILARAARREGRVEYQGVVLDWPKLKTMLLDDIKDQFPDARLQPVKEPAGGPPERTMSALPVQLDPGPTPEPPPAGWTPLRIGLVLAWAAAVLAFAAVGLSGWSLMDLAERRIRFVSAVTHELRTPLTSLRLYLDLLLSGMVQDEQKRQEYLATLNTESDRLHRLIDNVLDFARLERSRTHTTAQPVKVCDLLEQLRETWADRCVSSGKELVAVCTYPTDGEVCTDPRLVQQVVGNLIDNARKYAKDAADRRIWLWAKPGGRGWVVFEVEDRGPGVQTTERRSIFRPFRRGEAADTIAGGAGLGLALAKQWAEALGGRLAYRPADGGVGACFRLELRVKGC